MTRPNLPPLYELIELDSVDSVMAEAQRRVADGADEGTVVWSREHTGDDWVNNERWQSQLDDFSCAVVLRPDFSRDECYELVHVSHVALLSALAGLLAPGVDLRHCWPDGIIANDGRLASGFLSLSPFQPAPPDWLILGHSVHLQHHPENASCPQTSVKAEQGTVDFEAGALLESYARHFLSWINRWADEGFAPVRRAWLSHLDDRNPRVSIALADCLVEGEAVDMDSSGALLVEQEGGQKKVLSTASFWESSGTREHSK